LFADIPVESLVHEYQAEYYQALQAAPPATEQYNDVQKDFLHALAL
jgi:hypothetical protein